MIKVNRGNVELEGNVLDLVTELTSATRGVLKALAENEIPEEVAKELVDKALKLAFKSKNELRKEAYEAVTKLSDRLFDALFGEESKSE